ncbi:unnamed protein product [Dovyalis caffra]|uniref:Low-temperature-induced 65 kDa protein n=1 Tax=Dovyalis caffra TaxID=77055 RepID=A0AAV1RDU8_9ROSI|nr:unnamed protein product [Dovyalis caffra]
MAHPQSRTGAMAPPDFRHRHGNSPRTPASPTVEELLRADEVSRWSPHSPTFWKDHELEYDQYPIHKKSVIAKVKERAKKWRSTLSKKKHSDDGNPTPSWGVSLDDDEEDDENPEYLGAPMYESEMAPEGYKEAARQHPRAIPVISEKHALPSSVTCAAEDKPITETVSGKEENKNCPKTLTETVGEKLAPAYATVSDVSHAIASKIQSLAISTPEAPAAAGLDPVEEGRAALSVVVPTKAAIDQVASDPARAPIDAASGNHFRTGEQKWDKGVSVKEYIMHKFEPGEDDKALSQAISQAISPRKVGGDASVVDKVKDAVNSLLRGPESSQPTVYHSAKNSSSNIPISTDALEVTEEENHARILQAN